jgi:prefoldin subunit 5
MIKNDDQTILQAIQSFRLRAVKLRRNSTWILVMIISVLGIGIGIFVFAGQIAQKDANQAVLKEKIERLESLKQKLGITEAEIKQRQKEYIEELSGQGITGLMGAGPAAAEMLEMLKKQEMEKETMKKQVEDLNKEIDIIQNSVSQLRATDTQLPIAISAIATRIGTIILILFLVQILVPLYRYNTRLATYYEARADALLLVDLGQESNLEKLVSLLSPDTLDFSKAPATPTQQAVDWAKEILSSQREKITK